MSAHIHYCYANGISWLQLLGYKLLLVLVFLLCTINTTAEEQSATRKHNIRTIRQTSNNEKQCIKYDGNVAFVFI